MCTAILSLGQFRGAELWLVGWVLCAAVYFGALLIGKRRRRKGAVKNVIFWFLAAEVLTDLIWALVYYREPGYIHYGVAGVYGLLFWPVTLLAAAVIAALQNQKLP